ncbi:ABC transporter ATP-binding protein [Kiloniella laminariae]|uniref:ABC transporter ATP-binding protein n=1 Tax=Kiloniella laminariae TaxID=454162 RepID=A0ABT4LIM3_9PROT|nr:ABC transporter ATP-binding protein [Kiloniella laminariae]MCZ4280957.1 ABC transporter ATP-binding protein [Kiloniella laminariae]
MTQLSIEVENLCKSFDEILAVRNISFTVAPGETVALLGGNGAGKTTTISILLGVLLPTSGTIRLLGQDIVRDRFPIMHRINFSSPYVDLPRRLTVRQNLMFFCKLYGIVNARERIAQLSDELELKDLLKRQTGSLSAGQKTRVSVAKALINEPEILLLDEPTASLDPDTADWVRSYLKAYQNRTRAAILLASHNMSEVERLCDNVLMMKSGQIVDQGTPCELLQRYSRTNLEEVFLDIARDRNRPNTSESTEPRENIEVGDI